MMPNSIIGRRREVELLRSYLDDASGVSGRMVLLAGEPGVGKTRLATEIAEIARSRGLQVTWGRSKEAVGAPPLWPWIEALRSLALDRVDRPRNRAGREMNSQLAQIFTEMPEADDAIAGTGRGSRHALFEALRRLLTDASLHEPRLLILEDLHWADPESMLFLEYLEPHVATMRILVLATYRDVEVTRTHPLAHSLGALSAATTERIELRRLDPTDTASLLAEQVGRPVTPSLSAMIHERTEGNPFFVREMAQLIRLNIDELGADAPEIRRIPAGVRDAIGRRLNVLAPECNQMLRAAAVLGQEFDYPSLKAVGAFPDEALDWVEGAVTHGILQESSEHFGLFEFRHHLIREVLLDELSSIRRTNLHRAAVEVLRAEGVTERRGNMTTLPQHVLRAAPVMDPADAAHILLEAGTEASRGYAWQSAVAFLEPAWEMLTSANEEVGALRVEVGTAYGSALMRVGRHMDAAPILQEVATLGIALRLPELAARAVIARAESTIAESAGLGAAEVLAPLFAGVAAMSDEVPSEDRVGLLRAQSLAVRYTRDLPERHTRSRELAREALRVAREDGSDQLILRAATGLLQVGIVGRFWEEFADLFEEARAIAARIDNPEGKAWLTHAESHRRELLGELDGIAVLYESRFRELSRIYPNPHGGRGRYPTIWLATLRGDFQEALEAIAIARTEEDLSQNPNAHGRAMAHALAIHRCLGTVPQIADEAREALSVSAEQLGTTPDAWLALLEAELGETDGARRHLEGIVQDDFQAFEEDQDRLSGLATAADACSIVGDADIARALYRELVQGEGRNPSSELGASGSSFRELGQLAALMGEDALAREHFDAALDFNRRMGARPWSAWTEIAYAEFLMTSETSTDRVRALELTAAARATAVSLGMVPILLRCDRLLAAAATAPVGAAPETPGGLTSRERDVLRLLAGGMSNLEIAAALVISVRTVERHITNIYGKIDARGRADATAFAIRAGIA